MGKTQQKIRLFIPDDQDLPDDLFEKLGITNAIADNAEGIACDMEECDGTSCFYNRDISLPIEALRQEVAWLFPGLDFKLNIVNS